jgi:hypothetical protein
MTDNDWDRLRTAWMKMNQGQWPDESMIIEAAIRALEREAEEIDPMDQIGKT